MWGRVAGIDADQLSSIVWTRDHEENWHESMLKSSCPKWSGQVFSDRDEYLDKTCNDLINVVLMILFQVLLCLSNYFE